MTSNRRWEHFDHGADIGVRGYGETLAEAFSQVALALTGVITDPMCVEARVSVPIRCEASDSELLLADWLNAIIFEMAVRNMLFCRFDVEIANNVLVALIWGEAVDIEKHNPVVEIKGATYTALAVTCDELGHWCAQCVVDV